MTSCCPTINKAVTSLYLRKKMEYYIAGMGSKKCICIIPDIFGRHPNVFQVADEFASRGFLIVMPDLFRDKPWPMDKYPPTNENQDEFKAFLDCITYEKCKQDVNEAINLCKQLGAKSIGMLGMCWGGKIVFRANADGLINCGATAHPSFLVEQDGLDIKTPMCVLPSKDESSLLDVKNAMNTHSFASKNRFQRFDDLSHGFMAARIQMYTPDGIPAIPPRVIDAIDICDTFFKENL